eukprot:TRINITY_DN3346_c2_g1_i1.p1 TRINITY_DN3346_c2_g1~~TRINITY_DN3346_c2_g1_i1.p1  ORF type:complete len:254 (-),score=59.01 TRINITY_DN3346_c2_g1_i1:448-1209(-)
MADVLAAARVAAGVQQNGASASQSSITASSSTDGQLVQSLARLVVAHDRQIQALEDRHTFVLLLYDPELKSATQVLRDAWRAADQKRRNSDGGESQGDAALKCSQRSLVLASVMAGIKEKFSTSADSPAKAAAGQLAAMTASQLDLAVFRCKPKHDQPLNDNARPWVWQIIPADNVEGQGLRSLFNTISRDPALKDFVHITPQHSTDGNLCAKIQAMIKKSGKNADKGRGKGGGAENGADGLSPRRVRQRTEE